MKPLVKTLAQFMAWAMMMLVPISGTATETLAPPRLSTPTLTTGATAWSLKVATEPGWFSTLQSSSNLIHWETLQSVYATTGEVNFLAPNSDAPKARFFRAKANTANPVTVQSYQRWTNAIFINNGLVEAIVVPPAGRVLQFRFLGDTNGPFWENPSLYGQKASSSSWNTAGSFGGDKAWPSPQSDWGWPPPSGFDGSTNSYAYSNGVVSLITPVDSTYRIRTTRHIELGFDEPVMRIKTIFERTAATSRTNKPLGVWIITQVKDPVKVYVPLPAPSIFTNGYTQLGSGLPTQFRNTNGFLSFTRDRSASHKIGSDAGSLIWVGTNLSLRIDAPRVPGLSKTNYPDNGSSAEVYTNPNPAAYVELELLGPLSKLQIGETMELTTTYTLFRRRESDPDAEAIRVLAGE